MVENGIQPWDCKLVCAEEMLVRMESLEEILDTSGALDVLAKRIDDRWRPY